MSELLCVDPGSRQLGWAALDQSRVVDCGIIRAPYLEAMLDYLTSEGSELPPQADTLVVERPYIYRGPQQKGDPNDILVVALVVGAVIGSTEYDKLKLPSPKDWKGTVDKVVMGKRILSLLSPIEKQLLLLRVPEVRAFEERPSAKSVALNTIDAIGLGLKHTGRLT